MRNQKKNSNSYPSGFIEFLDGTKKVQLAAKKKFGYDLEDITRFFLLLTTPYVMFATKKTQILIEFLDQTQKSFLVAEKRSPRV